MTGPSGQVSRPFRPEEFEDPCEDCGAPAGQYCRDSCWSGYTVLDARHDQARLRG